MGIFTADAVTDRARGGTSTAAIGNASVLGLVGRVRVDDVLDMTNFDNGCLIEIGDMAGVDRCSVSIYTDATGANFTVNVNNGTNDAICEIAAADISDGEWLHIYADVGGGTGVGTRVFVEDDSGNALGTNTQADWDDNTIGASGSGNGIVSIGQGVDNPAATDAWQGQQDGWAVYSSLIAAGDDRHDEPLTTDTDIEGYWPFPTSGTSAEDQVASQTLTFTGGTFAAGGAWDEPSSPPVAEILSRPRSRWRTLPR